MSIDEDYDDEEKEFSIAQELIYDGSSPEEMTSGADIREIVDEAVESLSPKQKMTFILKHYEGYKIREIAEMLNCKEGTVKKYLSIFYNSDQDRRCKRFNFTFWNFYWSVNLQNVNNTRS